MTTAAIMEDMNDAAVSIDHRVMGGAPCIADTRIPVTTVLGALGEGHTIDELLIDYPTLTRDGILVALRYAAHPA